MSLIVALVMFGLCIQSFIQHQYMAGAVQLIIALGFTLLLIDNIIAVRNGKQVCGTSGCKMTDWFAHLFKKEDV